MHGGSRSVHGEQNPNLELYNGKILYWQLPRAADCSGARPQTVDHFVSKAKTVLIVLSTARALVLRQCSSRGTYGSLKHCLG